MNIKQKIKKAVLQELIDLDNYGRTANPCFNIRIKERIAELKKEIK